MQWRQNLLQAQWVWSSTSAIICSISRPKAEEQTSWRPAAAQRAPPGASRGQSSRCAAHDDRGTVLSETPTSSAAMPPDPAGPRRRRPAAGGACSGRTALSGGMCSAQGHAGRRSWGTAAPSASQVGGGAGLRLRHSSAAGQSSGTCVTTAHRCRLPSEIICDRLGQLRSADLHRPARECAHRGCGAARRQPAALPGGAGCIASGGARRAGVLPSSVVPCCFAFALLGRRAAATLT